MKRGLGLRQSIRLPRNAQLWLPAYLRGRLAQLLRRKPTGPVDILFCIADHYEPNHAGAPPSVQAARVERWVNDYPTMVDGCLDSDGRPPQHTFFFPAEAYDQAQIERLGQLCRAGFGEVEVHLHHGHDTEAGVRKTLSTFRDTLSARHGLLSVDRDGRPRYGFIHGNWALDNGFLQDRFCGVNTELKVLIETGCYADFTMPAAPDFPQSLIVNSIYYARDDEGPRSYDRGRRTRVGGSADPDELLMVNGPLSVYLRNSRVPIGVETGALDDSPHNRLSIERFRSWVSIGIAVAGREEWIVVKVYSHGAKESNADTLLGAAATQFHRTLGQEFNEGQQFRLHYVTAREIYNIVKAAEAGKTGNAGEYRDFELVPKWRAQPRRLNTTVRQAEREEPRMALLG